jgi:rubrerythrin
VKREKTVWVCDRCGEQLEGFYAYNWTEAIRHHIGANDKKWDLCPVCSEQLRRFVEGQEVVSAASPVAKETEQ